MVGPLRDLCESQVEFGNVLQRSARQICHFFVHYLILNEKKKKKKCRVMCAYKYVFTKGSVMGHFLVNLLSNQNPEKQLYSSSAYQQNYPTIIFFYTKSCTL